VFLHDSIIINKRCNKPKIVATLSFFSCLCYWKAWWWRLLINLVGTLSFDILENFLFLLVSTCCFVITCWNCCFAGETLINERINGGTFTGSENFQLPNKMMPVSSVVHYYYFFILKMLTSLYYCLSWWCFKQELNFPC
jgi:hypothetical protein